MNFLYQNIFLIALTLISGGLLFYPMLRNRGPKASPLIATQFINQGKTLIIDVRDAEEFAQVRLRDAKNYPLADVSKRVAELQKGKNKTYLVVCQTGARSAKAVSQLLAAGLTDVYSLDGGLVAWQAAGLPVIKAPTVETKSSKVDLEKP